MVGAAELLRVGRPGGPAGAQGRILPVGGGGLVPPDGNGHGYDEREEAVVSRPLGVQTLKICGTPWSVRLLVKTQDKKFAITTSKMNFLKCLRRVTVTEARNYVHHSSLTTLVACCSAFHQRTTGCKS